MYIKILKMFCLPFFLPFHAHGPHSSLVRHDDIDVPKHTMLITPPRFQTQESFPAAQNSISFPSSTTKLLLHILALPTHPGSHVIMHPKCTRNPWHYVSYCLYVFLSAYFLLFQDVTTGFNTASGHGRGQINAGRSDESHAWFCFPCPSVLHPDRPHGCLVTGSESPFTLKSQSSPEHFPPEKNTAPQPNTGHFLNNKEALNSREDG